MSVECPSTASIDGHVQGECPSNVRRLERRIGQLIPGEFRPKGVHGRIVQVIRSLDADPNIQLRVIGNEIEVPSSSLTLRALAQRCGVSSPSSTRDWLKKWRADGMLHPDEPIIYIDAVLGNTPRSVPEPTNAPHALEETNTLDVILRHLAQAHQHNQPALAADLKELAVQVIGARGSGTENRANLQDVTARDTERSEVVSSSITKELTNYSLDSTGRASNSPAQTARSRTQLETLLQPLIEECSRRSLLGVTNADGASEALAPYSDEQVQQAQRLILADLRAGKGKPIQKPIGLLVKLANVGSPEYFTAPPPTPPIVATPAASADPRGEPDWATGRSGVAAIQAERRRQRQARQ